MLHAVSRGRFDHAGPAGAARRVAWILLLCGLGCAQISPPSGGPEDRTPPRVRLTFPDSGAVSVPLLDSLALVFSEPMNRRTVETSFFLSPPVEYRQRRWRDETWILRLSRPLDPGRTYVGLLGRGATDRHGLGSSQPWSFAFSTGESLDTGMTRGRVIGQRYAPRDAFVFVWPWSADPPDTTAEGFPPEPLRLGQADEKGEYRLEYLPRGVPLRVCALYDQDKDQQFNPGRDQWACAEEPVVIGRGASAGVVGSEVPEGETPAGAAPGDTLRTRPGVDLYLTYPDEPGTVAGTVADSVCIRSAARRVLERVRADRDSLRNWLDEGGALSEEGAEGGTPRGPTPTPPSLEDSLRIGRDMLRLDSLETAARAESLHCAFPVFVRLLADTTLIREAKADPKFRWTDVPPGIYRLLAFRDLNADGRPDVGEPAARSRFPFEVRPLRVLDGLDLLLEREP